MYGSDAKVRDDTKTWDRYSWCEHHMNRHYMDMPFAITQCSDNRWRPLQYQFPVSYLDIWIPGSLSIRKLSDDEFSKKSGPQAMACAINCQIWVVTNSHPRILMFPSSSDAQLAATSYTYTLALQWAQLMQGLMQAVLTHFLWINLCQSRGRKSSMGLIYASQQS